MNEAIIMAYDPFDLESRIWLLKDGKQEEIAVCSSLVDLTKSLVTIAYQNNVYDMKFRAPAYVVEELKKQISCYESKNYSMNQITIKEI